MSITEDQVLELNRLRAENERLKAIAAAGLTFKISDKGCLSVYGLGGRYPQSMYKSQWNALLNAADALKAFIATHEAEMDAKEAARPKGEPKITPKSERKVKPELYEQAIAEIQAAAGGA
jgi:hypothetical protein